MAEGIQGQAPLIIDMGSYETKVGLGGEASPMSVFRTINHDRKYLYKDPSFKSQTAIDVNNWTDWMNVIQESKGKVGLKELPNVLLTEPALSPKEEREEITRIMFENFKAPAFYIAISQVLALFASGRTTGIVVDIGHSGTTVVPVVEGYVLPHAIIRTAGLGGKTLTEDLKSMESIKSIKNNEFVQEIKEKFGYVALDFQDEMSKEESTIAKQFLAPDGTAITISHERYFMTETLFQPAVLNMAAPGVHEMLYNSIMLCDADIRKDLYANILLTGGSSLFPGLKDRMYKEITALAPPTMTVKIIAPPERKYSAWIGGSILTNMTTFTGDRWISKKEYQMSGPEIVHWKCF